jgi:toxin-antitoxin system PIN domain toxin
MAVVVDTNVLVYAQRTDAPQHGVAWKRLRSLATEGTRVGLPWPCVYEFLRIVTHPRVYTPPTPVTRAWEFVEHLLSFPSFEALGASPRHAEELGAALAEAPVVGNLLFDAHIAVLAREHGFREILTEDRDFHAFPWLRVVQLGAAQGPGKAT